MMSSSFIAYFLPMIDDIPMETVLQLLLKPRLISRMPFGKHQGKALEEVPKHYISWLAENGALDKPENRKYCAFFPNS